MTRDGAGERHAQVPAPMSQVSNGLALIAAKVITMGLGFVFWVLAARMFSTHEVGLAAGVVSAMRRGEQALVRNAICAVATVGLLALLAALGAPHTAQTIFVPWALAGLAAGVVGVVQLRRALPHYQPRPAADRRLMRELTAAGLPNYALTLAERAPGLILPVLVAELLSPSANATWYAVWMMAWVVYIVPIQVGMTIFAEVAHDPLSFRQSVRRGVLCALAVGTLGALILGAGASLALSILGPDYAADGAGPLRILLLALLPLTFTQAYFSSCRARRSLGEAIATGWTGALASVALAVAVGVDHGLTGMAIAWVAVQCATGLWSLWRLRRLSRHEDSVPAAAADALNLAAP